MSGLREVGVQGWGGGEVVGKGAGRLNGKDYSDRKGCFDFFNASRLRQVQ